MNAPKRHHFLPQFFLNGFSRDGYVALFDRDKGAYRVQPIKDTAVIGYFYSAEDAEGNKDGRIEGLLSDIESQAKPVITKLDNRETLTEDDKQKLAMFVGFLYARTPEFHATVNQVFGHGIKHMMQFMYPNEELAQERYGEDLARFGLTAKDMVDFVKEDQLEVKMHRNVSLEAMLRISLSLSEMFIRMNWLVAVPDSDKQSFVLTDSPVNVYPPRGHKSGLYGAGMAMAGVVKVIPLSAKTCLAIGDFADKPQVWMKEIGRERVRNTNLGNVIKCHRYVIGRDEALVRNLVETTGVDKTPWKSKVRVG